MTVRLVYFAWVRERIGRSSEMVDLPADVRTVRDLIAWLTARDATYAHAFERSEIIRAALDQVHAPHDAPLAGVREIAFFPPVTGG
jgi:molybdopterin synthase sulfur carrier subunit